MKRELTRTLQSMILTSMGGNTGGNSSTSGQLSGLVSIRFFPLRPVTFLKQESISVQIMLQLTKSDSVAATLERMGEKQDSE
jgi:hypothetical protein